MTKLISAFSFKQVRETITEISRADPDEAVRASAERFMPKVNWVANRINTRNATNAGTGKQKDGK